MSYTPADHLDLRPCCPAPQCSRFHGVENFDGNQRSCRQQLARHAERRRLLRRARKGQPPSSGQHSRSRQQASYDNDYPAKRQRAAPAPAPVPAAFPPLPLPPLPLPPQQALPQALPQTLQLLPTGMHSTGLQQLGLDRADSGGSCDSQLGLPAAASGGAPGAIDPALAAFAAVAPGAWRQPDPQGTSQLSALLLRLAGQQGQGAAPAAPPPVQAAAPPLASEQQLVSLLGALVEQQQAQQAQQRANAAAAILETLLQNQAAPLPAPSMQAGGPLGSAFLGAQPVAAPAAPAPAAPPDAVPSRPQPAAAPAADQSLTALLAQLVGSLSK